MSNNKYIIFIFIIPFISGLCTNMETYSEFDSNQWLCLPCGNEYTCKFNGIPADECWTNSVPDCELPTNANQWLCCRNCQITGSDICQYDTPQSTTTGEYNNKHDDNNSHSEFICKTTCVLVIIFGILIIIAGISGYFIYNRHKKDDYQSLSIHKSSISEI